MKIFSKLKIAFYCLAIFGAGNVAAQDADVIEEKTEFQSIDTNKDGFIATSEMDDYQVKYFNNLDKNIDGRIDTDEFAADKLGIFTDADTDNDGEISKQEANLQFKEYLKNMDSDNDNKISEDEYTDYWKIHKRF